MGINPIPVVIRGMRGGRFEAVRSSTMESWTGGDWVSVQVALTVGAILSCQ